MKDTQKTKFKEMNKDEALTYCYKYENEFKSDMWGCGEDGEESFAYF